MSDEKPYDASDPHDVNVRIRAARRWDDKRSRVIVGILSTEDGRRWIRETLESLNVGANPFNPDALRMSYNCGILSAGQGLMAQVMNASPQLYMQMMSETASPENDEENRNG